jgi:hypothetical protein
MDGREGRNEQHRGELAELPAPRCRKSDTDQHDQQERANEQGE